MKTVRVRIIGRVQGVWFRAWTQNQATAIGVNGWVRNRRDGAVEAQFSGDDAMVDQMIAECHKGPPAARVDEVRVVPESGNPVPGFKVLPAE